jgi:hypothetical protein
VSVTPERALSPEFQIALYYGRPLPGVEPGSDEERMFRAIADDASRVAEAAPPMAPDVKAHVAALLQASR